MRGRKPKPAALEELQGRPGKRGRSAMPTAAPDDGAQEASSEDRAGVASAPRPPDRLKGRARDAWSRLAPELARLKFLRPTDMEAFARYCAHLARYWELTVQIRKKGETYWTESRHGRMQRINPLFIVRERLENRLESLEDRFGLSPRARQEILKGMAAGAPPFPGFGEHDEPPEAPGPRRDSPVGVLGSDQIH